jgi:hypothetical protein
VSCMLLACKLSDGSPDGALQSKAASGSSPLVQLPACSLKPGGAMHIHCYITACCTHVAVRLLALLLWPQARHMLCRDQHSCCAFQQHTNPFSSTSNRLQASHWRPQGWCWDAIRQQSPVRRHCSSSPQQRQASCSSSSSGRHCSRCPAHSAHRAV